MPTTLTVFCFPCRNQDLPNCPDRYFKYNHIKQLKKFRAESRKVSYLFGMFIDHNNFAGQYQMSEHLTNRRVGVGYSFLY